MNASRVTYMIGLRPQELEWVRLLVNLLRHQDSLPPELARQALIYVNQIAESGAVEAKPDSQRQQA